MDWRFEDESNTVRVHSIRELPIEGTTISHYRVLSRLGAGAMGEVWLAEDIRLKHQVAIKVLLPHLASEHEAKARFITEATAIARLEHPSIVPLLECDERDGLLFLVTPYYPGGSLREHLDASDGKGLALEQVLDWAISIAAGIGEAHERGILHRDIKPANLLLSEKGELRICDFGLAKLVDATQITRSATTMGTVSYMSPEQVRGERVDAKADLWALGVLLYELATGKRPFDRENMQASMRAILEDEPPSPSRLRPELPEEFDWIVGKCLQKEHERRYADAAELLHDLEALRRQIVGDGTVVDGVRARPLRRRSSARRALLVTAVVTLMAVGAWYLSQRSGEPITEPSASLEEPVWNDTPRVVVMPFENRTGDEAFADLEERTAEVLAQGLQGIDLLDVMPWNAGVSTDGTRISLDEMPLSAFLQAVDADMGVSGSYYLDGQTLQLETQVLDARTGELILSMPTITASPEAPREGIEELAQRVMGGLAMRLDNPFHQPPTRIPPRFDAYEQFAKARDGFDSGPWPASVEQLNSATALDSTFWRPQVWIPLVFTVKQLWAMQDTAMIHLEENRERLDEYENGVLDMLIEDLRKSNARSALSIAKGLLKKYPEDTVLNYFAFNWLGHLNRPREALEVYEDMQLDDAFRRRIIGAALTRGAAERHHGLGEHELELKLHREKNEYFPFVLFYLDELYPFAAVGKVDSLRAVIDKAATMPGGRGYHDWSVWTAADVLRGHDYREEAIAFVNGYLRQRLERKEDAESGHLANNHALLLYKAERWGEAQQMFEDNIEFNRVDEGQKEFARTYLGFLAARRGDHELARQILAEQIDDWEPDYNEQGPYLWRARFEALMGEQETAVFLLREAAAHGASLGHHLVRDQELQSLRGYEPFERMIQPQG